jgi:hypothetical protein
MLALCFSLISVSRKRDLRCGHRVMETSDHNYITHIPHEYIKFHSQR